MDDDLIPSIPSAPNFYSALRILLIGPMTNVQAHLIGGATISFGQLVQYVQQQHQPYSLINTQRFSGGFKKYLHVPFILLSVFYKIWSVDVLFLNSSRGGTKYLAPVLYTISRIFGKKFVFRPFGGDLKDYTSRYNSWQKWLFKSTVLRADLLFLQTRALVEYYTGSAANIAYLPTSRPPAAPFLRREDRPFQKRFIFLGHVNEAKGIDQLLEACSQLDPSYAVHIFGPITETKYRSLPQHKQGLYQGVLRAEEVLSTLRAYDVLLLPTHYEGEGYPGSIMEAYSLGLPVISTRWKAIPEVVKEGETGLLISPQSSSELLEAIRFFHKDNYAEFSKNALDFYQSTFNTEVVLKNAFGTIQNLFATK